MLCSPVRIPFPHSSPPSPTLHLASGSLLPAQSTEPLLRQRGERSDSASNHRDLRLHVCVFVFFSEISVISVSDTTARLWYPRWGWPRVTVELQGHHNHNLYRMSSNLILVGTPSSSSSLVTAFSTTGLGYDVLWLPNHPLESARRDRDHSREIHLLRHCRRNSRKITGEIYGAERELGWVEKAKKKKKGEETTGLAREREKKKNHSLKLP